MPKFSLPDTITLAQGSGGTAMQALIEQLFRAAFDNALLSAGEDQARISLETLTTLGDRLALTTDSYVVTPLFFPGGDIGALAVNGTVNDLAVGGAIPLYLTCGLILEEGLSLATLKRVIESMQKAAIAAGVKIVTGDTKVVPRGSADQLFINTAGVGVIPVGVNPSAHQLQPGDCVLINGAIGNHGAAILVAREDLALTAPIESDCQPLNHLVAAIMAVCPQVRAMRDATRGGLATVLTEFAQASQVVIRLQERALPIDPPVEGLCELLGLDPLYLANEGKLVVIVPRSHRETVLAVMQAHPQGQGSCWIGEVLAEPSGLVTLQTPLGTERILDPLVGDQLPRIC